MIITESKLRSFSRGIEEEWCGCSWCMMIFDWCRLASSGAVVIAVFGGWWRCGCRVVGVRSGRRL